MQHATVVMTMIYFAKATQAWPVAGKAGGAKLGLPRASHLVYPAPQQGRKVPSQATGHQFPKWDLTIQNEPQVC